MRHHAKEDFLAITDWDESRLRRVLDLAIQLKQRHADGQDPEPFTGAYLSLVFQKPSLRTRVSFEVGFGQLGGRTVYSSPSEVGLGERESVADVARVLGRYVDAIVARVFAHSILEELAREAPVPVINGLSDYNHPCQILGDLLTIIERRGSLDGARIAWIGDGNNVAVSWINAARRLPIHLTLACPAGYEPHAPTLRAAEEETEGRVRLVRAPEEAAAGADVLYADTWTSMGQEKERQKRLADLAAYKVDLELLAHGSTDVAFMHCLPAHRGEEVSDEVMDGPHSAVYDQAENRLHAQKAILVSVLGAESAIAR